MVRWDIRVSRLGCKKDEQRRFCFIIIKLNMQEISMSHFAPFIVLDPHTLFP